MWKGLDVHCPVAGKKPQEVVRARILDDDAAYALAALVKEDQDGATVQVPGANDFSAPYCLPLDINHDLVKETLQHRRQGGRNTVACRKSDFLRLNLEITIPFDMTSQVVCLGCGFDTRPWRLRRGGSGRGSSGHRLVWYEVDRPHTLELKRKVWNSITGHSTGTTSSPRTVINH